MKIKVNHGCNNNTYICGIDGKEFSSIKELEQYVEKLIKEKSNNLVELVKYHCWEICTVYSTGTSISFPHFSQEVNCIITELSKLTDEYDKIKYYIQENNL